MAPLLLSLAFLACLPPAVSVPPLRLELAAAAPSPPRIALVQVLSPPALAGYREGVLATFSSMPTPGKILLASTPPDDPLGCRPHAHGNGTVPPQLLVVRRGNCSFLAKAELAKAQGAEALLVVSDNESVIVMGDGGQGLADAGLLTLNVQKSLGDAILAQKEPVQMSFQIYSPSLLDWSEALLVTFATVLVGMGALVSTADLRSGSPLAPQEGDQVVEIDNKIAVTFCLGGSVMLVVFFFLMDYLIYFIIFGFCLAGIINFAEIGSLTLQYFVVPLRGRVLEVGRIALRVTDMLALVPSVALGVAWLLLKDKPGGWFLQDVMGFGFLCWVQRIVRLPSLKVGALLLCIMFCFDIFWVFISPVFFGKSVMVKVASGGSSGQSVPLLFRIPAFGDPLGRERMLGFGDIAVPGLLVSFLHRHDVLSRRSMWKGYFGPGLLGYFLGLWATIASLLLMKMAQPALLYLVPGTLGTTVLLALKRKELSYLWHAVPVTGEGMQQQLQCAAAQPAEPPAPQPQP